MRTLEHFLILGARLLSSNFTLKFGAELHLFQGVKQRNLRRGGFGGG